MGAIQRFQEIYENRHQYGREWKSKHPKGKVVGYFCTYLPEEILYAAGILPVRLLGSHESEEVTAPYIFNMFCPHCRDVLAQGLKGKYDYLDGIAASNCCMHMLQSFEAWAKWVKSPSFFRVDTPASVQNPRCKNYLRDELECFKEDVERWVKAEVTDAELDRAMEVYNENRGLMHQIYELRKESKPPISGLESMYMVVSSQFMDKAEHNLLLREAIEELKDRRVDRENGNRLMFVGSENDDPEFYRLVEQGLALPATVVIDDHCNGSRYFWNEVIPQRDRLHALASRYIDRPPCPAKDWPTRRRFSHVLNLAKEWKAEGAIVLQQKFCDPHEMDIPSLRDYLERNGIPTYFLELEVTVPVEQFKTRLEAFVEMLLGELV